LKFLQVKEPLQLSTVLVDPKAERKEMFCLMLGDRDLTLVDSFNNVDEVLAALPVCELVMLCADAVTTETVADIKRLSSARWGILVLLDIPAPEDIETLVAAGADHVLPLRPQSDRFSVATAAAVAQARRRRTLEQACSKAHADLEDAKKISRAKMILMARHTIDEDEAHKRVQKMSMKRNLALPAMARQIIDAEDLLC